MFFYTCGDKMPVRPPTYARRRMRVLPQRCYTSDMVVEPLLSILLQDADRLTRASEQKKPATDSHKYVQRLLKPMDRHRVYPYHKHKNDAAKKEIRSAESHQIHVAQEEKQSERKKMDWRQEIDCAGFHPGELRVRVSGDRVHVHARRHTHDGENIDTHEMRRTIPLPPDVDKDGLQCQIFAQAGLLVLHAPRLHSLESGPRQKCLSDQQKPPQKQKTQEEAEKTEPTGTGSSLQMPVTGTKREESKLAKRKTDSSSEEEDSTVKKQKREDAETLEPNMDVQASPVVKDEPSTRTSEPVPEQALPKEPQPNSKPLAEVLEGPNADQAADSEVGKILEHKGPETKEAPRPSQSTESEPRAVSMEKASVAAEEANAPKENSRPVSPVAVTLSNEIEDSALCKSTDSAATEPHAATTKTSTEDDSKPANSSSEPAEHLERKRRQSGSPVPSKRKPFRITLDLQNFSPEDCKVTAKGNELTVSAERQVKEAGSVGLEKLQRRLVLPGHVDANTLKCLYRDDGMLLITASAL